MFPTLKQITVATTLFVVPVIGLGLTFKFFGNQPGLKEAKEGLKSIR